MPLGKCPKSKHLANLEMPETDVPAKHGRLLVDGHRVSNVTESYVETGRHCGATGISSPCSNRFFLGGSSFLIHRLRSVSRPGCVAELLRR